MDSGVCVGGWVAWQGACGKGRAVWAGATSSACAVRVVRGRSLNMGRARQEVCMGERRRRALQGVLASGVRLMWALLDVCGEGGALAT